MRLRKKQSPVFLFVEIRCDTNVKRIIDIQSIRWNIYSCTSYFSLFDAPRQSISSALRCTSSLVELSPILANFSAIDNLQPHLVVWFDCTPFEKPLFCSRTSFATTRPSSAFTGGSDHFTHPLRCFIWLLFYRNQHCGWFNFQILSSTHEWLLSVLACQVLTNWLG